MDARGSAARRRGRPPSSSHSPPPSRRRGLRAVPPRLPHGRVSSDGVRLRRGRPPGRGRSSGCPRSIIPPNSDLLPMPAASPRSLRGYSLLFLLQRRPMLLLLLRLRLRVLFRIWLI
jgi:hypothetical protein